MLRKTLQLCLATALLAFTVVPSPLSAQPVSVMAEPPSASGHGSEVGRTPVAVPEPSEKARRYYRSSNILWIVNQLLGVLIPLAILFTGLSATLRNVAARIGRNWFFVVAIYSILLGVVTFLIDLPMSYYMGYVRQHAYGLSNQTFGKWSSDQLKALMVALVVNALVLWVPFLLIRKSPRRWWLFTGLALFPFVIVSILVAPVLIDPLFNKFGPMKDRVLETEILSLAGRAGIDGARVYEVDKSLDTKTVNAYVTGLGRTKRIVLWDTTLTKLTPPQVLSIMGHEMGHFVLGHVRQLTMAICVFLIAGLYFVHRTSGALLQRYGQRWGVTSLADVASLPLMTLLLGLALFVMTPAINAITRHNEHEADRFALEITRDNRNAALAFVKLQQENLAIPRPGLVRKIFRESHPPLGERIDFANRYRPWETGQTLRYGERFRAK
ncbi:MAG TPA: M48 family metallopeptidase [Thermoanaerobaculia bacterium]|nr:M48 family metallopeptidase [Thermoanaerobaculia bacterium]